MDLGRVVSYCHRSGALSTACYLWLQTTAHKAMYLWTALSCTNRELSFPPPICVFIQPHDHSS